MIEWATVKDIEYAANHPSIIEHFSPEKSPIDMSRYYDRPGNVAFKHVSSVMLFPYWQDSQYDCHFLFLPDCRGRALIQVARAMIGIMFTHLGADAIVGAPPRDNRAVRRIGTALGFQKMQGSVTDHFGRECCVYGLDRGSWAISLGASSADCWSVALKGAPPAARRNWGARLPN